MSPKYHYCNRLEQLSISHTSIHLTVISYSEYPFFPPPFLAELQRFLVDTLTLVRLSPHQPAECGLKRLFDTDKPGDRDAMWVLQTPFRHAAPP